MERKHLTSQLEHLAQECKHDFPAVASILHYLCAALIARRERNLAKLVDVWGQQHFEQFDDS